MKRLQTVFQPISRIETNENGGTEFLKALFHKDIEIPFFAAPYTGVHSSRRSWLVSCTLLKENNFPTLKVIEDAVDFVASFVRAIV